MKKGFRDPTEIRKQDPGCEPQDGKKSPWDFRCPQYDQRSSCFVAAGTNYGIGHKQPVGHFGNPSENAQTLPPDRRGVVTMNLDRP